MIAVTAASGRLGRAILKQLSAQIGAASVVAVARDPKKLTDLPVAVRAGDYTSLAGMTEALAGIDTVVLISAPVTPGTDRVAMHRNVLAAAKAAAVKKVVFTSVIGGAGEETTWFGATQAVNRATEEDVRASGLEWVVARNCLYLELDVEQIIKASERDGLYQNNAGDGRCPYLTIDELAVATARMALDESRSNRVYNLGGDPVSQAELVGLCAEVFGLDVRYAAMSDEENLARFMQVPHIAARGEEVARMLTGCFQCIRGGIMDVPSDFAAAAGRPAKPLRSQLEELRARRQSAGGAQA